MNTQPKLQPVDPNDKYTATAAPKRPEPNKETVEKSNKWFWFLIAATAIAVWYLWT